MIQYGGRTIRGKNNFPNIVTRKLPPEKKKGESFLSGWRCRGLVLSLEFGRKQETSKGEKVGN